MGRGLTNFARGPTPESRKGWAGHLHAPPTVYGRSRDRGDISTEVRSPALIQRRWGFTAVMARGDSRGSGKTKPPPLVATRSASPALIQRSLTASEGTS
jgi:hypothetical protein